MTEPGSTRGRSELAAGLVAIARDFLGVHQLLRDVARSHRSGQLDFARVQTLVGDDEGALLYRLKEHSHALFRPEPGDGTGVGPEALFDLAIGSLFHEAMKFRENFYQRDAYGPKVESLRAAPLAEAKGLLSEFEKILAGAGDRIEESLQEAEALLGQTTQLFRVLLRAHRSNGFVTRYLLENPELVTDVFGESLDDLLAGVHGSAGEGWALGARSYLESGFFAEASAAALEAERRGAGSAEMDRMGHYARGMQAFLQGGYGDVLRHLEAWSETPVAPEDERLVDLAVAALGKLPALAGASADADLPPRAAALIDRLSPA